MAVRMKGASEVDLADSISGQSRPLVGKRVADWKEPATSLLLTG
jgi:hypothetical protein